MNQPARSPAEEWIIRAKHTERLECRSCTVEMRDNAEYSVDQSGGEFEYHQTFHCPVPSLFPKMAVVRLGLVEVQEHVRGAVGSSSTIGIEYPLVWVRNALNNPDEIRSTRDPNV